MGMEGLRHNGSTPAGVAVFRDAVVVEVEKPRETVITLGPDSGTQGERGPTGPTGPTGPPGPDIMLAGAVASEAQLPQLTSPDYDGTAYVVETTGDLWVFSASSWHNVGPIEGPQGTVRESPTQPLGLKPGELWFNTNPNPALATLTVEEGDDRYVLRESDPDEQRVYLGPSGRKHHALQSSEAGLALRAMREDGTLGAASLRVGRDGAVVISDLVASGNRALKARGSSRLGNLFPIEVTKGGEDQEQPVLRFGVQAGEPYNPTIQGARLDTDSYDADREFYFDTVKRRWVFRGAPPMTSDGGEIAVIQVLKPSTGRLNLQHTEIGYTGSLDIKDLVEGAASEHCRLARSGNVVDLQMDVEQAEALHAHDRHAHESWTVLRLPEGFRPSTYRYGGVQCNTGDLSCRSVVTPSGEVILYHPVPGRRDQFCGTWITDDAWPASLTGRR